MIAGDLVIFDAQGPAARQIATLGWTLLTLCSAVYVAVLGALAWALVRRRDAADEGPETSRRLAIVVATAVAVTTAVQVVLTGASAAAGRGLTSPPSPSALSIDHSGRQWWWDFQYTPESTGLVSSPNELHVPVGVPVVVRARSQDVIHSLWVPNLHGKRDLIPGQTTSTWLQADKPGVYRGLCAEFCGHQHAKMAFIVVAQPRHEFEAWLRAQRAPARDPATADEQRGRQVFLGSTCATCHTIRGTDAGSRVGPDLTHVASRRTLAAGTLPNTLDHLREWVDDPSAAKPGTRMPPQGLSHDEFDALIAYLRSLR